MVQQHPNRDWPAWPSPPTAGQTGNSMHAAEAIATEKMILNDNGGRRLGDDRRLYSYNGHIPERRSGKERRAGIDRRKNPRFA